MSLRSETREKEERRSKKKTKMMKGEKKDKKKRREMEREEVERGGEEEGRGDAENGAAAHCSRARQARDNIPGRNSNVLATGYRCDERFSPAPCLG